MEIRDFYKNVLQLEDEALLAEIVPVTEIQWVAKRRCLTREGEVPEYISFVISGCLCGFSQNSKGEEVVTCFCCRLGDTTMTAFSLTEPAVASIVALTDSVVLSIPTAVAANVVQRSFASLQLYNRLLEQSLRKIVTMQMVIYRGSAMERFQWFLKEYPGLIETINNKYIASFLQMTNVTLSRLRRMQREQQAADQPAEEGDAPPQD